MFSLRKREAQDQKVSFMIVGAQKGGTTSLHYYLSQIDGVYGSTPKETDFFSYDGLYKRGYKYYHQNFFKGCNKNDLLFESSVEYMYLPYVAKRLYKYNPDLKIIICLRDPVERALSAYNMYKYINSNLGDEWRRHYLLHLKNHSKKYYSKGEFFYSQQPFPSFEKLVDIELDNIHKKITHKTYEPSLIKRGLYGIQIDNLLNFFDRKQLHIVKSKNLSENPEKEIKKILDFLGIGNKKIEIDYTRKLSGLNIDKVDIPEDLRSKLKTIFQSYNNEIKCI